MLKVAALLTTASLLFLSLIPLRSSVACPVPVPWAVGETRTCWPSSHRSPPPVSGGNQTPPFHLLVSPCPPRAPWPLAQDSGQERLHCAFRHSFLLPHPSLYLEDPSTCCLLVPALGQQGAPFWCPGLPDVQQLSDFGGSAVAISFSQCLVSMAGMGPHSLWESV